MKNKTSFPSVSIIIPCLNEESTITLLLEAISAQDYPKNQLEVVIADSMSQDGTREKIHDYAKKNPDLKIIVIDNVKKTIPAGVNCAAENASGNILIRLDAHSAPNEAYVKRTVTLLEDGSAENVGGIWEIKPGEETCIARAIARAAAHPLGVGDAKYRISKKAQYVDTVPFGAFYKKYFFEIGAFDESLLANEDYEFNTRLRKKGGRVWLDPGIRSKYFARKNLRALGKQYWRYGFWKVKMLRRYPKSLRARQAIPPLFVLNIVFFSLLGILFPFARIILLSELLVYLLTLLVIGISQSINKKENCLLLMPLAMMTMHFSWGTGFLFSFLNLN